MPVKTKKQFEMNDDHMDADALSAILDSFDAAGAAADVEPAKPTELAVKVDEVVQGLSGAKSAAQVYLIDTRLLEPYPDQPFKSYPQDRLAELAEDIKRVGILSPILARKHKNKLQVLAGHNRLAAAKLVGLAEVPVLIMDADDDQAVLVVTSTNLRQREKLMPSEKAFAYKMQMDALKRQGQRGAENYSAAGFITEQTGDSRMQIHRYIRLTELDAGLLELLDKAKISMTPAVAVSYLTAENQRQVFELIRDFGASLTIDRANALKALTLEKESLTRQEIDEIMLVADRKKPETVQLRWQNIRPYLPVQASADEAEKIIIEALKAYYAATN